MQSKDRPEDRLARNLALLGFPEPEMEYRFHPDRNWRLDLAWPDEQGGGVACEVEGGIWLQTRTGRPKGHAHPGRFLEDVEKYNEAALEGWKLIRVTPEMIDLEDGRAVLWLARALNVEL